MNYAVVARPATNFWKFYCRQLDRRPLLSRCLTGVVGAVVSDSIAQHSAHALRRGKSQVTEALEYDYVRTARLIAFGFVIGTPLAHTWFQFLDKGIMPNNPRSMQAVITKTLMDQLLMAPFGTALFFCGMKCLEGRPDMIKESLMQNYLPTLKASYMIWPAVHLVNFRFVPPSQRILYMNVVSILWGSFMSHMVSRAPTEIVASDIVMPEEGLLDGQKLKYT